VERLEGRAAPSTLDPTALVIPPPDSLSSASLAAPALTDSSSGAGTTTSANPVATGTTAAPSGGSTAVPPATPPAAVPAATSSAAAPATTAQSGASAMPPPTIQNMGSTNLGASQYAITAQVTDPANNVAGVTVTVSGDGLGSSGQYGAQNAAVTPVKGNPGKGTFQLTVQLPRCTNPAAADHLYTAVANGGNGRTSDGSCEIIQTVVSS
jgi:hypothetical protein